MKKYIAHHKEVIGREPDRWASLVTYASLQALQQAIEKAGTIDKAAVAKQLASGTFDTILGKFSFDKETHRFPASSPSASGRRANSSGFFHQARKARRRRLSRNRNGRRQNSLRLPRRQCAAHRAPRLFLDRCTDIESAHSASPSPGRRRRGGLAKCVRRWSHPHGHRRNLSGLTLGGMYALIAHGADAAIRRRAHHQPGLWRGPDRRVLSRAYCAVHIAGIGPLSGLLLVVPLGFALCWASTVFC